MIWEVFGAFFSILELTWVRRQGLRGLEARAWSRDIESRNQNFLKILKKYLGCKKHQLMTKPPKKVIWVYFE